MNESQPGGSPRAVAVVALVLSIVLFLAAVPSYEMSARSVLFVVVALAHHASAALWGSAVLSRIAAPLATRPERWWLAWALGLGCFGHIFLLVGHLGFFVPGAAGIVPALGLVGVVLERRALARATREMVESVGDAATPVWGVAAVAVVALSLAPPLFHDTAAYHVALPQQWMLWGKIIVTDAFPHSAVPLNGELSLAPTLLLTGDPRAMGAASGVTFGLLVGLIAAIGKRLYGGGGAAAVVLTTMPLAVFVAVAVKGDLLHAVDVAALLLTVVSCIDGKASDERDRTAHARVLGVFGGLVVATKASGLALAPCALLALIAMPRTRAAFGSWGFIRAVAIALVVAAPLYVQNTILLGNPLYPFFSDWLGGPSEHAQTARIIEAQNTHVSWSDLVRLPWDLAFVERDPTMSNLPGPLVVIFVILAGLFRPWPAGLRITVALAAATVPVWLGTQSLLRYDPMVWVTLPLVAGYALTRLWRVTPTVALCVVTSGALVSWGWILQSHEVLLRRPMRYFSGLDDREFLLGVYEPYAVYRFINESLPADAIVLPMSDMRFLYLARRAILASLYGPAPWWHALRDADDVQDVLVRLRATGATHLIYEQNEVQRFADRGWTLEDAARTRLQETLRRLGPPLFSAKGFDVYALPDTP